MPWDKVSLPPPAEENLRYTEKHTGQSLLGMLNEAYALGKVRDTVLCSGYAYKQMANKVLSSQSCEHYCTWRDGERPTAPRAPEAVARPSSTQQELKFSKMKKYWLFLLYTEQFQIKKKIYKNQNFQF